MRKRRRGNDIGGGFEKRILVADSMFSTCLARDSEMELVKTVFDSTSALFNSKLETK